MNTIEHTYKSTDEYVDVADLDTIFLTYDEPKKEEFWVKIKNMIPWAKRVDGVEGSDSAHKAAAAMSDTERFILIDGDNLPNSKFFDITLHLHEGNRDAQFRWRAKNHVNGLFYGNGGISCWTKTFVNAMKTHENTDGSDTTNIEFCFDHRYWPMHDCYSTTYIDQSPKQAWRAGFREGVKMCTRDGTPPPSTQEFLNWVWPSNLTNLSIWHTIGRDNINGFWAILGARTGTHYLMLNDSWDHTDVRDFTKLDALWELHKNDDETVCSRIAGELNQHLRTNIIEFDPRQSKFFKDYISKSWTNTGPMKRETHSAPQQVSW
jgi:hypothetical protein